MAYSTRTSNWNGYRACRAAGGGALNGYRAPKRAQDWSDGETVKVGFLTLEVVAKVGSDYRLWNPKTGAKYTFTPHQGLTKGWFDARGHEVAA